MPAAGPKTPRPPSDPKRLVDETKARAAPPPITPNALTAKKSLMSHQHNVSQLTSWAVVVTHCKWKSSFIFLAVFVVRVKR